MTVFVAAGRRGGNFTTEPQPKTFGARGSGATDDRFAFVDAAAAHDDITVEPGTYLFSSSWTLPAGKTLRMERGALLKPASGQTITIEGDIEAGRYQIFDLTAGGLVVFDNEEGEKPEWRTGPTGNKRSRPAERGVNFADFSRGGDNDDTTAFASAMVQVYSEVRDTQERHTLLIPAGRYNSSQKIALKTFEEAGPAWNLVHPVTIDAMGRGVTIVTCTAAGASIGHPNFGSTSAPRGQNYGPRIRNFTLIGPRSYDVVADAIQFHNCRGGIVEGMEFLGYPRGAALALHAYQAGGAFRNAFRSNLVGRDMWRVVGSKNNAHFDDLRDFSCRHAIRIVGANDSTGKPNDFVAELNYIIGCLGFPIDTLGFGEGGLVFGGPFENLLVSENFFYAERSRKMYETTIASAASGTAFTIDLTDVLSSGFLDSALRLNCYIGVRNAAGTMVFRWIDTFASDGAITVTETLGFTPDEDADVRIGFGDAAMRSDGLAPSIVQATMRLASDNVVILDNNYDEEQSAPYVVEPGFNPKVCSLGNQTKVHDLRFAVETDGETPHGPIVHIGPDFGGSDELPVKGQLPHLLLHDGSAPGEEAALMIARTVEAEGATLRRGEPVSMQGDQQFDEAINWTANTGHVPQFVAWSPYRDSFADGGRASVAIGGLVKLKVRAAVAVGDSLMPMAAGYFEPYPVLSLVNPWRMASTHARKGSTANWVVDPASDTPVLASLGASESAQRVIIHLGGLGVGDYIRKFAVVGRIESGGNAVALTATLYRAEVAAGAVTHTALSPTVALSGIVADTKLDGDTAAATSSLSAFAEIQQDRWYYVLIEATTGASCGIEIGGIAVQLDDRGRRVLHGRVAVAVDAVATEDLADEATSELDIGEAWCWAMIE